MDPIASKLGEFVIKWRWPVLLMTLLLVIAAGSGGRHLAFSNNYRAFFSEENPDLIRFENFQATYTKNDNILFVVQPKDTAVFSPRIGQAIEEATAAAWKIPFVIRVDSISNYQHSWANEDDLTVEDLIRNSESLSQEAFDKKKAIALAEPLLKNNLISHDADTTGINVTLQYPELSLTEVPEAVGEARKIADDLREKYPELTIALSGVSMLNNAFAESGMIDMGTLVPLMYLILLIVMIIMLRSFSGTISTLMVVVFGMATAMGLAGYFGIKLTPISATAPTIIMTLAIADSIHIIVTIQKLMRGGMAKIQAIKESLRINCLPVTVTSITTIIGFLGLNFSDVPPFNHLGNITAMGIAGAWAFSLLFLPALLSLLPMKVKVVNESEGGSSPVWDRFADFIISRYKMIAFGLGGIAVGLTLFISTIELNDEWIKYFDHRVQFRHDAEFGIKHLNGIYLMEFSMKSKEEGGINDPEYLKELEKFTEWLRGQEEVMHVYSYTDIIKRLNKNMHGDDPEWYRIPENKELAAQYLLLYELSLPFGLDLNDRVNVDKSATRLTASLPEISTARVREFIERSEWWLQQNTPEYMWTKPTSATVMFSYIADKNIKSMLNGNAVALVLISIIMIFALKSVKLGIFSLVPNALPILITFGLWAILVGQIGMAAATVTSTSLGIIVDDTVHFLTKYMRARREKGLSAPEAIRYAFNTVGTAIVITTIVLAVGFSVLATSTFLINAHMGLLTALAIVVAVVFDLTLLPALLLMGNKKKVEVKEYEEARV